MHLLRKSFPLFLLALLLISSAGSQMVSAQEKPIGRKVTLDLQDVSLFDALKQVFRQARVKYQIAPDIIPLLAKERRTLSVKDKYIEDIVRGLFSTGSGLPFYVGFDETQKTLYRIDWGRIDLEWKETKPQDALLELLTEAGINFVFANEALGAKPITLALDNVPFPQALSQLLQTMEFSKELSFRLLDGICVVERAGWKPEHYQQTLSLQLTDIEVIASLRAICRSCNVSYTLPLTFVGRVSSQGNDVPFKQVLSNVLRQLRKDTQSVFTYTVLDGIICFVEVLGIENPDRLFGGSRINPILSPKEIQNAIEDVIRASADYLTAYQILAQLDWYTCDQLLRKHETLGLSKKQVHAAAAAVNQIALQLCQSGVCEQITVDTRKVWVEIGKDLYQPEKETAAGFRVRR